MTLSLQQHSIQHIQCKSSIFIMLFLGSIRMENIISEACLKRIILQRNYRKMTIKMAIFQEFFAKFHGKKNWEPEHD